MRNYKNIIGIKAIFIATILLLSGLNLSAQYKLELEWQKTPGGNGFATRGIAISNDDSIIIVSGEYTNGMGDYLGKFLKVKTSSGEVVGSKDTVIAFNYIKITKDGKSMICGSESNSTFGIYDYETFEQKYSVGFPFTMLGFSFCEPQMKAIAFGKSYVGNRESLMRIYDLNTKSLLKEFPPSYFGDIAIKNASITDDGKYIIYGYETYTSNPNKTHYFVKMIDLDGKLIKDFGETSSSEFTTTFDGKTLIYFDNTAMHFFDLENMKEIEGITIGGADPEHIEMSSDGKFMLAGYGGGLVYYDLETKKSFFLNDNSTWDKYLLNSTNSSLFFGGYRTVYKFNINPTTSLTTERKKLDLTINIIDHKLILTNPQNHQINTLTAYDIIGRTYSLSANGNEVDISALAAGKYFLKVGLADASFLDFSFVKE